jgi:hypothetical protein
MMLTASTGFAGTVLVVQTESFATGVTGGAATVYLDGERLRIESREGGGDFVVIFRQDNEDLQYWIIDNARKTYVELSEAEIATIRRQVRVQREQFKKQLDSLLPEQQVELRAAYPDRLRQLGLDAPTEYTLVSRGIQLDGRSCDYYTAAQEQSKVEDVWVAGWKSLGFDRSEMSALGGLADLVKSMGQNVPAFYFFAGQDSPPQINGFPVMVVRYSEGTRVEATKIVEVRQETFTGQLFELPDGLTKQAPSQFLQAPQAPTGP